VREPARSRNLTSAGQPELAAQASARQPDRVSEVTESARRWSGYVCPDCRFVFRVPRDHDGVGIVCPSCRRLLKIPGSDDSPPPLLAPIRVIENEVQEEEPESHEQKRRRRKRKKNESTHSWEKDGSDRRRRTGRFPFLPLVLGVVFLITVLGALIFVFKPGPSAPVSPASHPQITANPEPVAKERDERMFLIDAEELAGKFLNATRVEEFLPLVANPEITGPRIRTWHPDGVIEPRGLRAFNINQMVETSGAVSSVYVTTDDFIAYQLFYVETPEGLRIDWESWSGWSELPWEKFIKSKPTDPKTCRVRASNSDYYNFAFMDESKWRAYRLESADGEHVLFGYVERDSLMDLDIAEAMELELAPMILELGFPENEVSRDQVVIHRFVAKGWVDPAVSGK